MRNVRLRRPHNRQVRRNGRRFLEVLKAGDETTVTEREFQAFRDRFVDLGQVESIDVIPNSSDAAVGGGAGVEEETPGAGANSSPGGDGPDIEQLRREASELGIEVNPRWREKRLMEEIDRALALT